MIYPKFDQKINDQIQSSRMQQAKTRMATVASYDRIKNTLTLIMESQYSDTIGNIVGDVPCPSIYRTSVCGPRARR
jgi:hypothetical protein